MNFFSVLSLVGLAGAITSFAAPVEPLPYRAPARMPDMAQALSPADVHLDGFLGTRIANSEKNRLVKVDLEPLLAGFRKKPGVHPWIGEHIGKWLHAATLAWAYTGDPALRAKMDYAVAELVKAQEPDGYLGTYPPDKRFGLYPEADWDVWSHKYDLIGLLTYYQYTGNPSALAASRKIGDLLIATFGPGRKSILSAGTHVGMAATSVLEPVVLLYRDTGDERYLDFARYLVRAWDEPGGPKIIATLLQEKSVAKTANGKAYEMLSNLVGLCELARATGDRHFLEPAIIAWEDIVAHRLYLTGSASQGEHFHGDYELPNQPQASLCETCVTVTWLQLTSQLLRLTGEARFGDQLEKTLYNNLAAAQRPDGAEWCYFTALEGTKPYGPGINCCVSSGPRGLALAPQLAYLRFPARDGEPDRLAVNLFETSRVTVSVGGQTVTLKQSTRFPQAGSATIEIGTGHPASFGLRLRTPAWAQPLGIRVNGRHDPAVTLRDGWTIIPARAWRSGDRVEVRFKLEPRLVLGDHSDAGLAALTWGPFVLAYDERMNPGLPVPALLGLAVEPGRPPFSSEVAGTHVAFRAAVRATALPEARAAVFVPFADAGSDGGRYAVWLRAPGAALPQNDSVFAFGRESRSRAGNVGGSICDGEIGTFVVTFDNRPAAIDWFAVRSDAPVTIRRVVFAHGKAFHDGGWFDAGAGKPRVQVQREAGGPWEDAGVLEDYPATTASDPAGLKDGQPFTLSLEHAERIVALRVIGKPASGDNLRQAFASCAELQAFGK